MKREKLIKKAKRLATGMLVAIVVMESCLNGIFLKSAYAQEKFEEQYGREEFIKVFGKNYL